MVEMNKGNKLSPHILKVCIYWGENITALTIE